MTCWTTTTLTTTSSTCSTTHCWSCFPLLILMGITSTRSWSIRMLPSQWKKVIARTLTSMGSARMTGSSGWILIATSTVPGGHCARQILSVGRSIAGLIPSLRNSPRLSGLYITSSASTWPSTFTRMEISGFTPTLRRGRTRKYKATNCIRSTKTCFSIFNRWKDPWRVVLKVSSIRPMGWYEFVYLSISIGPWIKEPCRSQSK